MQVTDRAIAFNVCRQIKSLRVSFLTLSQEKPSLRATPAQIQQEQHTLAHPLTGLVTLGCSGQPIQLWPDGDQFPSRSGSTFPFYKMGLPHRFDYSGLEIFKITKKNRCLGLNCVWL